MIPKKFQSFILPHDRARARHNAAHEEMHATFGMLDEMGKHKPRARLMHSNTRIMLQSLRAEHMSSQYTGKKRGPKKHGPIAMYLRRFIRQHDNYERHAMNSAGAEKVAAFLDTISDNAMWYASDKPFDEYATFICMAYAIALDQGV